MILVAAYCRVSTDKADQANSFESQKCYFREFIQNHKDWLLYEIYADEGVTGTSTKKRIQFNRMIRDAHEGKFNLIVTKEVSRFSRNILDTIAFTRKLSAIGVGVRFVNDGIDTLEPDAELRLSIMASIAQEESRRTSSRVVWGQTRKMEQGVVFGTSMLGYDVKNGALSINSEGAKIVRLIFHKYALEQMGTSDIARYLTDHGYRTYFGHKQWHPNTIIKILRNEKYAGDLIQKKSYTPDFLTHEKRSNKGQVPMIVIRNHHDSIIDREIWNLAQARLGKNCKQQTGHEGHPDRYIFSGKIKCGQCGGRFVGRYKYLKDGGRIRRWSCNSSNCDVGKLLREDDALEMLKCALVNMPIDREAVISDVIGLLHHTNDHSEMEKGIQSNIQRIHKKKEILMDTFFSGDIGREDMVKMNCKYDEQIASLRRQILDTNKSAWDDSIIASELDTILKGKCISEVLYKTVLDSITVFKDRHMEVRLHGSNYVFVFDES